MTATTTIGQTCGVGDNDDYHGITNLTVASSVSYTGASGNFLGAQDTDGGGCSLPTGSIINSSIDNINIAGQTGIVICFDVAESTASDGLEDWDANSNFFMQGIVDGASVVLLFAIEATTLNSQPGFDCDNDGDADGAAITDVFTTYCTPLNLTGSNLDLDLSIQNLLASEEDIAIDNIAVYSDEFPAPAATNGCMAMPVCSITNVTASTDGTCSGDDATYTVCTDVSGGSGDYNLTDVDNGNAVISSLTGQADGNICFIVTLTGPTAVSTLNVNVVDASDPICLGEAVAVSIPVCPVDNCEAMIVKFPANGN